MNILNYRNTILRPVIFQGTQVDPIYLYEYKRETTGTTSGTVKVWYYQYDWITYQFALTTPVGTANWEVGKNIVFASASIGGYNTAYNWQMVYGNDTVTSTSIVNNSFVVSALDGTENILGTIYSLGGGESTTTSYNVNLLVVPATQRQDTNGSLTYTGSDGGYTGILNGLLVVNTYSFDVTCDKPYIKIIQSGPGNIGLGPFLG